MVSVFHSGIPEKQSFGGIQFCARRCAELCRTAPDGIYAESPYVDIFQWCKLRSRSPPAMHSVRVQPTVLAHLKTLSENTEADIYVMCTINAHMRTNSRRGTSVGSAVAEVRVGQLALPYTAPGWF